MTRTAMASRRHDVIETGNSEYARAPGPRGRRTRPRDSLLLSATVQRLGEAEGRTVRVRNLSAIGVMADYDAAITVDEQIVVSIRGLGSVAGRVAWVRKGRIGIMFDNEVDPLKARRPIGKGAPPL
jgi:hypothetical protein